MLPQQLDGARGQSIAFPNPAFPSDVGVHIVGVEADRIEHAKRVGENLIADTVARHDYDGVLCHELLTPE